MVAIFATLGGLAFVGCWYRIRKIKRDRSCNFFPWGEDDWRGIG